MTTDNRSTSAAPTVSYTRPALPAEVEEWFSDEGADLTREILAELVADAEFPTPRLTVAGEWDTQPTTGTAPGTGPASTRKWEGWGFVGTLPADKLGGRLAIAGQVIAEQLGHGSASGSVEVRIGGRPHVAEWGLKESFTDPDTGARTFRLSVKARPGKKEAGKRPTPVQM